MKPNALAIDEALESIHRHGDLLLTASGLYLVQPDTGPVELFAPRDVALLLPELLQRLDQWKCGLCGRIAELPDYCSSCGLQLKRWHREPR